MKKITVYCGESIEDKCGQQQHPLNDVKKAYELILSENDEIVYSNSPDFISAIKYIGFKHKIKTEFYLNDVYCCNNIEIIFEDLKRSLKLMDELSK